MLNLLRGTEECLGAVSLLCRYGLVTRRRHTVESLNSLGRTTTAWRSGKTSSKS